MSEPASPIPPQALIAAGLLIGAALLYAGFGRQAGLGQAPPSGASAVRSVELRFHDAQDGGVVISDQHGREVERLAPQTNGFIRGVVRSLVRARRQDRVEADPPFRLTQWSDHRLTLEDPATGQSIDISGFGKDNRGAFARLLASGATLAVGSQNNATAQ